MRTPEERLADVTSSTFSYNPILHIGTLKVLHRQQGYVLLDRSFSRTRHEAVCKAVRILEEHGALHPQDVP